MFIPSGPLGNIGIITDLPEHTLPLGAWSAGSNMRFSDGYIERVKEPLLIPDTNHVLGFEPLWFEQWIDSTGVQVVYASANKLFKYNDATNSWDDVSKGGLAYSSTTKWQSFAWGTSVVFNNGIDPPQILYDGQATFVDLPNWGLISSDPANPTQDVDTQARCAVIRPYQNFLVAINVEETATNDSFRNRVWWSSPATRQDSIAPADNPSWDYADPGSLSGIIDIATEDGPLIDQLQLGSANIIYTRTSFYLMLYTQDPLNVFNFDRGGDYGIATMHAVAQFNNVHLCVSADSIYTHDGSTVQQLSDGRVQRGFFGRNPVLDSIQVEHYIVEREVHILFQEGFQDPFGNDLKTIFAYNYKDNTFFPIEAYTNRGDVRRYIAAINYGTRSTDNVTWNELTGTAWNDLSGTRWLEFYGTQDKRYMLWMNTNGIYQAEGQDSLNGDKRYYVERSRIDLSELDPKLTSNRWKELTEMYPHIETNAVGKGICEISVGWHETLFANRAASNIEKVTYDGWNTQNATFRTTGRYLYLQIEVVSGGDFRFSSIDYDLNVTYGR